MSEFSEALRIARASYGKQRNVARLLGVSQKHLCQLEKGHVAPSVDTVDRICAWLKCGKIATRHWHILGAKAHGWKIEKEIIPMTDRDAMPEVLYLTSKPLQNGEFNYVSASERVDDDDVRYYHESALRDLVGALREASELIVGWRENDWPEGFDRRTAELITENFKDRWTGHDLLAKHGDVK